MHLHLISEDSYTGHVSLQGLFQKSILILQRVLEQDKFILA